MRTRTRWGTWFWKGAAGRLVARQERSGSRWGVVNRQYRWRNDAEAEEASRRIGGALGAMVHRGPEVIPETPPRVGARAARGATPLAGTRWGGQHAAPRHSGDAGRWILHFKPAAATG